MTNSEADIKAPHTDDQYRYYRFSVDEWAHWEHDGFAAANVLLAEANKRFSSLHTKDDDDSMMDEFEIAHSEALLEAVVQGLEVAKAGGMFGSEGLFLVVWISDSDHPIMAESVRRLNSRGVAQEFIAEFG